MKTLGRFRPSEITPSRLFTAVKIRMEDLPHVFAWQFQSYAKANRRAIYKFHNIHFGKRCFIVANGPSLKQTNLELLSNDISFGLNRIYINFQTSSFRPTYLVSTNEVLLDQFANEIQKINVPKFTNWNKRNKFHLPDSSIIFLKPKMVFNDFFQNDITKPMVFGATVTNVALQIAFYMGFSQVILVGLDHNFVEKGRPNKIEKRDMPTDESHFNPQYFPKGTVWQLPDLFRSEVDYQLAREAFEADGREILDATIDGKCQVFRKVEFTSLF